METAKAGSKHVSKIGNLYEALVENAREAMGIVQDGCLRFVNEKCLEISGYSKDELLTMSIEDIIHPDDRDWVMRRHRLRLEGKTMQNVYTHRILDKHGGVRWLEIKAVPVQFESRPAVMVCAFDTTERKLTEDRLRENERRYRSLFYSAPSGVFYYDTDLKIIEANERFINAFGREGRNLIGLNLRRIYDRRILPCLAMPLEGKEGAYEGGFRESPDSEEMWLYINTVPVYRSNGEQAGGIGIFSDMTVRRKTELKLEEREAQLRLKSLHLEEANATLQAILRSSRDELINLQRDVIVNIEEMVFPLLKKIKSYRSPGRIAGYAELVEMNLRDITSPFLRNLTLSHFNFTHQERQIARLIREGYKTEEIAEMLSMSRRSIEHHRYKIRIKLGLRHKKANLRTKLMSLTEQH
jgi:PAS domain S-box-containing protein